MLCAIGAIGNANMLFDTYCMVGFGLMSYLLIKSKVPTVPMILGFILGPTFEQNLRRVSQLTSSDPFWNHPIFCVLIIATVFVVIFSVRSNMKDAKRAEQAELEAMPIQCRGLALRLVMPSMASAIMRDRGYLVSPAWRSRRS